MTELIEKLGAGLWVILASEVVAGFLIARFWRLRLHWFEKCALTVLAVIPVVGPFFAWWLCHDPGPAPPSLQDRSGLRTNVYDRWRDVFEEPDPEVRKQKARVLRDVHPGDPP